MPTKGDSFLKVGYSTPHWEAPHKEINILSTGRSLFVFIILSPIWQAEIAGCRMCGRSTVEIGLRSEPFGYSVTPIFQHQ